MAATLRMYDDTYDYSQYNDQNTLYRNRMITPDRLNNTITYLYGRDKMTNIPLLSMTQGQKGGFKSMTAKKMNDTRYVWATMGRAKHTVGCLGLVDTTLVKPGLNHQKFEMYLDSQAAHRYYTIYSPDQNYQVRVEKEPELEAGTNRYKALCSLMNGDATSYISLDNFVSGKVWVYGPTTIPMSMSDGTASNSRTPGEMTNQFGAHRYSLNIAGNISNKVTVLELPGADGKSNKLWMPYVISEWEMERREAKEHDLWFSEYNRNSLGQITTIDEETGLPVPRGAGVKEQLVAVGNHSTYTTMTISKLNSTVHSVFGNRKDKSPMELVLYTGTAGSIQFHDAVMADATTKQYYTPLGEQMINGGDYLSYGKYFRQYRTINGYILTVVVADFFDHGLYAEQDRANGRVDANGYPYFSSTMVFLDHSMNSENGERNIQLVAEKGREHIAAVYPGMAPLPEMWSAYSSGILGTKKDVASYEVIDTDGIVMLNSTTSFWLDKA